MATTDQHREGVPRVTRHARLRYRQRVDQGDDATVDEKIREMFRAGQRVSRADVNGAVRRYGEHLLVFVPGSRPVIKTILQDTTRGERHD